MAPAPASRLPPPASREELEALFRGYGYVPHVVEGDDPMDMHQRMAAALDTLVADIRRIQRKARANGFTVRPRWPMIILRSPKGWTGPKVVDGKQTEGTFRSHQVPMGDMSRPGHVKTLEKWLRCSTAEILPVDDHVAPDGRVMEMLSEHQCQGWLE